MPNKEEHELAKRALEDKGLNEYLEAIDEELLKVRYMHGFAKKRSSGKLKFFQPRWMFLISSRPLNFSSYLADPNVLEETQIPPLLELDTLYFYIMGQEGDTSGVMDEVPTTQIIDVEVKDMTKSTEQGHAMIIDVGDNKYHLNFDYKFQLEEWREAILCSM